jgi:hypothetical protein
LRALCSSSATIRCMSSTPNPAPPQSRSEIRQVGYSTPFALSSAFKRSYGVSPTTYRANAAYPVGALEAL